MGLAKAMLRERMRWRGTEGPAEDGSPKGFVPGPEPAEERLERSIDERKRGRRSWKYLIPCRD